MIGETSGALDEMGWNQAEQPGHLDRAATSALLLFIGGIYWGSVWVLSGLFPLSYLATRAYRNRPLGDLPLRHRAT